MFRISQDFFGIDADSDKGCEERRGNELKGYRRMLECWDTDECWDKDKCWNAGMLVNRRMLGLQFLEPQRFFKKF